MRQAPVTNGSQEWAPSQSPTEEIMVNTAAAVTSGTAATRVSGATDQNGGVL